MKQIKDKTIMNSYELKDWILFVNGIDGNIHMIAHCPMLSNLIAWIAYRYYSLNGLTIVQA